MRHRCETIQVALSAEEYARLKEASKRTRWPMAALVREALDVHLAPILKPSTRLVGPIGGDDEGEEEE